jgi:MFS family permease
MTTVTKKKSSLTITRAAVYLIFFVAGSIFANWVSRIPQVQENLGMSEGILGFALLGGSGGVITGLAFASSLIAKYGSRRITVGGGLLMSMMLAVLGLTVNFVSLFTALFFLGACTSIMDVAMNAQAVEVERRLNKPIMSSFHAAWSVGTLSGALIVSRFAAMDFTVLVHFSIMSLVFFVIILIAALPLIPIAGEGDEREGGAIQLPPRILWPLGAVAFAAAISEGSMADWSGIYLRDIVGTNEASAALGFAAFSLMMTSMRFAGDWLTAKIGAEWIVRGGGILSATGILLALLFPNFVMVLLGFALVGVGAAVIIPLAFSAAGKLPNIAPGRGIAGVATIGYAGFLAGPPIIGIVADLTSLRFGLILVLFLALSLWFTGRALRVDKVKVA